MTRIKYAAVALLLATTTLNAQQSIDLNLTVKSTAKIPTTVIGKGDEFTINSITCDMSNPKGFNYLLGITTASGQVSQIDLSKAHKLPLLYNADNKDQYWQARSLRYSIPSLSGMTNAYSLRNKAEMEANKYVAKLRQENLVIEDPYLKSYINSVLTRINPEQRIDFFKYNFNVVLVKDDVPNAGIYPNGALVINAGLLARVHTEDELVALLCHEANHFICNHYLENMAKIQSREMLGNIGSAVVGAAAGILTRSVELGVSAGSLTQLAASELNLLLTAMGLEFDQSQEIESDHAAFELLPILGYDQNAMATCIQKIGNYYLEEGNLEAYYKSGKHPKIEDRIAATGIPYERRDTIFEKKMAPCVSYVVQTLFEKGRYSQAVELVDQNISNGVGSGMDYYIKGECLLASQDSPESNTIARESLLKARETYKDGLPFLKALIVSDIRLGLKEEARGHLEEFKTLAKDREDERVWADTMLSNVL